jgi:DNA invertase Pin-like site-specific DNA recombinase
VTAELENNFGPDFIQQMTEQFSQKAEMAAEKARETAEREQARAAAARKKQKKRSKPVREDASPGKSGGSTDAQLKILKMVEQGIISPDEANMLLEALEGD